MARKIPFEVSFQNFWKKVLEKETDTRLHWSRKYDSEFQQMLQDPTLRDTRVVDRRFEVGHKVTSIEHPPEAYRKECSKHRRRRPPEAPLPPPPSEPLADLDMFPPDVATRRLLFTGHSRNGEGTQLYLKTRKRSAPEQKYPYPVTAAWQHGWLLDGRSHNNQHPRVAVIRHDFYRPNGMYWQLDQGKHQLHTSNSITKE